MLVPLRYVPPTTIPLPPGTWTLIVQSSPTPGLPQQIVRLGTPPTATDVLVFLLAVLI